MTPTELQTQFFKETGIEVVNSQGEFDIDYVQWLEAKCSKSDAVNILDFVCKKMGHGKFIDKDNYWFTSEELAKAFTNHQNK